MISNIAVIYGGAIRIESSTLGISLQGVTFQGNNAMFASQKQLFP